MFGPWLEAFQWLKANFWPSTVINKRRLNFITIHYLYIISMSIIGSILLFPSGGLAYIDALFFASGAATQSGLNTVDINALNTSQQIFLYLMGMVCNPIFIHSFVVFVRLYWFERRFQNIVKDARNFRRSRTRTMTDPKREKDNSKTENGIRGQSIVVLHNGNGQQKDHSMLNEHKNVDSEASRSGSSSDQDDKIDKVDQLPNKPIQQAPTFRREVTFADEVRNSNQTDQPMPLLPQRLSPEEHIAFLENQRNPKDKGALRIPGPRDFDRGDEPEPLGDRHGEDGADLDHETTIASENPRNAKVDAPDNNRLRIDTTASNRLPMRRRVEAVHGAGPTSGEDSMPASARFLKARTGTFSSMRHWASAENEPVTPYLSWQPTIGRNSAFVDLTEEQREELGGIEYRSLKTLAVVLVVYYVGFHLLGVITLLPWIIRSNTWGSIVDEDGQSRAWWGIFTPASLFNDMGFTLTPDSMISFQYAVLPLLLGSFLIIIGNTGFPCMLRFTIWFSSLFTRHDSGIWEELRFLLDHPRRCFTLLFPTDATWWLFWILVVLNGLDMIFFVVLDLKDTTVTGLNPPGFRVLNGLFQAASTRTAGFASINLAELHPAIQVSYMIMMYISVFPIAISVRRTNVYEEKSLGIYGNPSDEEDDVKEPSYVGAHLRRQLSFDLWYIALGLFIIAIVEGDHLANTNEYAFTLFSVLFEIVSAYGTVGLSLGYPNYNTSFSGQFRVISKLVIIAMQIRGRHRGLPYELDRAILLPSDNLNKKDDVNASRRIQRRNSSLSNLDMAGAGRTPTGGTNCGSSTWPLAAVPTSGQASATGTNHKTAETINELEKEQSNSHHSGHLQRGLGRVMSSLTDRTHKSTREKSHTTHD